MVAGGPLFFAVPDKGLYAKAPANFTKAVIEAAKALSNAA